MSAQTDASLLCPCSAQPYRDEQAVHHVMPAMPTSCCCRKFLEVTCICVKSNHSIVHELWTQEDQTCHSQYFDRPCLHS